MDSRGVTIGSAHRFIHMRQKIIIFDSPDGCGKTEISKALSADLKIPYYKFPNEGLLWKRDQFKNMLAFGEPVLVELLKQSKADLILDRGYPSEWVYSKVFGRETDDDLLEIIDKEFARLGAYIIIPVRHNYENSRADDLVPQNKLQELHDCYMEFSKWSRCNTIVVYVDSLDNNLNKELEAIKNELNWAGDISVSSKIVIEKSILKRDISDIFQIFQ